MNKIKMILDTIKTLQEGGTVDRYTSAQVGIVPAHLRRNNIPNILNSIVENSNSKEVLNIVRPTVRYFEGGVSELRDMDTIINGCNYDTLNDQATVDFAVTVFTAIKGYTSTYSMVLSQLHDILTNKIPNRSKFLCGHNISQMMIGKTNRDVLTNLVINRFGDIKINTILIDILGYTTPLKDSISTTLSLFNSDEVTLIRDNDHSINKLRKLVINTRLQDTLDTDGNYPFPGISLHKKTFDYKQKVLNVLTDLRNDVEPDLSEIVPHGVQIVTSNEPIIVISDIVATSIDSIDRTETLEVLLCIESQMIKMKNFNLINMDELESPHLKEFGDSLLTSLRFTKTSTHVVMFEAIYKELDYYGSNLYDDNTTLLDKMGIDKVVKGMTPLQIVETIVNKNMIDDKVIYALLRGTLMDNTNVVETIATVTKHLDNVAMPNVSKLKKTMEKLIKLIKPEPSLNIDDTTLNTVEIKIGHIEIPSMGDGKPPVGESETGVLPLVDSVKPDTSKTETPNEDRVPITIEEVASRVRVIPHRNPTLTPQKHKVDEATMPRVVVDSPMNITDIRVSKFYGIDITSVEGLDAETIIAGMNEPMISPNLLLSFVTVTDLLKYYEINDLGELCKHIQLQVITSPWILSNFKLTKMSKRNLDRVIRYIRQTKSKLVPGEGVGILDTLGTEEDYLWFQQRERKNAFNIDDLKAWNACINLFNSSDGLYPIHNIIHLISMKNITKICGEGKVTHVTIQDLLQLQSKLPDTNIGSVGMNLLIAKMEFCQLKTNCSDTHVEIGSIIIEGIEYIKPVGIPTKVVRAVISSEFQPLSFEVKMSGDKEIMFMTNVSYNLAVYFEDKLYVTSMVMDLLPKR